MVGRKRRPTKDGHDLFAGLNKKLKLYTSTTSRPEGGIQSLCGLQLITGGQRKKREKKPTNNSQTTEPGSQTTKKKQKTPAAYKSSGIVGVYEKLGFPSHKCRHCGATMWLEEKANTGRGGSINYSICCQEGKVSLEKLKQPPELLRNLLKDQGREATKFRQKIRIYNSIFGFTSFGAKIDEKINETRGPYSFRISGQNYHRIGSLLPAEGMQPRYAQLYFYDTTNEVANRLGCLNLTSEDVDQALVSQLVDMLNKNSAVAKSFRMARDWANDNAGKDVSLKLIGERKPVQKQFNAPTVSEIATLIVGDLGTGIAQRDVVIQQKNGALQRISEIHPQYMALQYPLLFPYGEDGYHINIPYKNNTGIRQTKRGNVTMKEFYCYRIQQRMAESTTLIEAKKLFHQYLVDAYTSIEEQRLSWIRFHQKELRSDLYNNICDAVSRGDTDAQSIGRRIVLPATFTGGPRYMIQNYQDAMAVCRAFGNPTLFITFTANPRWPEVSEMLSELPGQTANDRPDVMTRVFRLKLAQLMKDLRRKEVFGPTKAAIYTIEFQKRGLPHAHILLWLDNKGKKATEEEINDIISAELPSKTESPELYDLVTEHMLHGPCGQQNTRSPCMVDGKCSKHFPKPYYASKTLDEEGYPIYRRRENHEVFTKGKAELDNRHVVPYNAYLLLKYRAHINVEWCNQTRAIKYLFKYISKGPDRTTIMLQRKTVNQGERIDEITEYLECRYISACEAVWRILGFDIHFSNPSVIRLPIHLPDENPVSVHDSQNLETVLQRQGITKTMLTEWFTLNSTDDRAKECTYAEIPQKFVWHEQEKEWQWRKQQKTIGRILYCHPSAGERYYLRLLLNYVKGPQSFTEIKTHEGILYNTFRETCYARGMLNDDKEWDDALKEASLWATGYQLRELFATILMFCEVSQPSKLWEGNWEALSEDILYKQRKIFRFPTLQLSESQLKNYCLVEIEEVLAANGKTLSDYSGMPIPDKSLLSNLDNRLIQEEMSYNVRALTEEHIQLHRSLNEQQLHIYTKVIKSVEEDLGELCFVYGAGGTGKTYLYKTILARLCSTNHIALAVASSGIAALLLPGGRTAHSRFLIPLDLHENSTCGITQNSNLARFLHETKLIIWDEAPMTQRHAFEALNRTLQDIQGHKSDHNRRRAFGGITMLLGGDFRQILPVIPKGKRQEIVQSSINNSPLWRECEVVTLNQSMRVNEKKEDGTIDQGKKDFNEWVLDIGDGAAEAIALEEGEEETWTEIPQQFILEPEDDPIQQVINVIYKDFKSNNNKRGYLQERAILTPLNEDADRINKQMYDSFEGMQRIYSSSDEVCMASTDTAEQKNMYPTEFLNGLDFPGLPPHNLQLKEELPVMLLRNVNPTQGLCNGTRLIIKTLGTWIVEAEIITGTHVGKSVVIPRISMTTTQTKWPFVLKRRQFPIKPCFAMTINKSQGQSLKHVALFFPRPVFCHGQLYVAISRVTDPSGLKIIMNHKHGEPRSMTKNIVFKEAFNHLTNTTITTHGNPAHTSTAACQAENLPTAC